MTRYRLDAEESRFTVQAFAVGLLSFLGHSPSFAIRDFHGTVEFEDDLIAKMRLAMSVGANSLSVLGPVKFADRQEIEDRTRHDVLDTTHFPEAEFRAVSAATERIAPGDYRVRLDGDLTLHGTIRPLHLEAQLMMLADGLRLRGETALAMSDFAIEPVTALGGTIRLQDRVTLSFDLSARPEAL
jgi:polyisoprenoid-binding protein YceI